MKEVIEYNYNIVLDYVNEDNNITSFYYGDNLYIFVSYKRTEEEIQEILAVGKELINKNIKVLEIMFTKDNNALCKIANESYIMLKVTQNYKEEISIIDIINYNNITILKGNKYKNLWGDLWSKKIDYFEYQIRERGVGKNTILDSFSYYIGLAENAVALVNYKNKEYQNGENEKVCLSHRRIFFPSYNLNYFNPVSFIFDLEVRDPAEYIKACFFAGEDATLELSTYLKSVKLTNYEYNMFYARLLYPSYYFDIYEDIINEEKEEDALIPIIKKVEDYEIFLKEVYRELSKYCAIENITWLTK